MLRLVQAAALFVLLASLLVGSSSAHRSAARVSAAQAWLAYGHDAQLTNFVRLPALTPSSASRVKEAWHEKLDGAIIASPLYLGGGMGGLPASRSTVFVFTEGGSVYALAPGSGVVRWHRKLGVVQSAYCGTLGISSTGAIDVKRRVLYVISSDGWLHALDLATGADKSGWPISITADHADADYVWGAVRLLRNTLYVPIASYCDAPGADGHYTNGRIVAIDVDRAAQSAVFDSVPGDENLGSMWGWGGVSIDPKGQGLYVGVGNSRTFDPACQCMVDDAGYGDAMVKLTPGLRVIGWDRPGTIPNTGDVDFGSAPLLFQPRGCPPLAAANNKIGRTYIWNRNQLGRGTRASLLLGGGPGYVGQPSYSPDLGMIFVSHVAVSRGSRFVGDGVGAFSFDSHCRIKRRWMTSVGLGNEPPPLVLGDVVFAPGGDAGGYALLAARTGRVLRRFKTQANTWAPAIAAGGSIFAGETDGTLHAFVRGTAKNRR
jgi:putative pyrroloquinoline-quinone binding quinoprotein/putative pyrroloquinoline-quinone-binding quinoprotein